MIKKINMDYLHVSYQQKVTMVWRLIHVNQVDVGRTQEEFVNQEPQASDLQILWVFFQHPKTFPWVYWHNKP